MFLASHCAGTKALDSRVYSGRKFFMLQHGHGAKFISRWEGGMAFSLIALHSEWARARTEILWENGSGDCRN